MSGPLAPRCRSSPARTALRLFAEFSGFAVLLFLARFVARAHLVPQMDQECHIGGIAVDVLAHGIRFPLFVYAPNEYDNGSFFSGLLTAVSFSVLGRNVLALKLVTHLISAAGAVATLSLLRGCLQELGLCDRRSRWAATAALVIALALAPRVVVLCSTYAVGNHAEGSAIDTVLLALFACGMRSRSAPRTAAFWALVGAALYLNKGTVLVIPVLAAVELALSWRSLGRLAAAGAGFLFGLLLELHVVLEQKGTSGVSSGWGVMWAKGARTLQAFPQAFFEDVLCLADYRIELLVLWILAMGLGVVLLARAWRQRTPATSSGDQRVLHPGFGKGCAPSKEYRGPFTLALVVGGSLLHLVALSVMAQGAFDAYAIYGYPTLTVLCSVLVAIVCKQAASHWGEGLGSIIGIGTIAVSLLLYRPDAMRWQVSRVSNLWRDRAGAACSWRFAEGFKRETEYGRVPPGQTPAQFVIERCRSLSEQVQILDCIGGIARELGWRHFEPIDPEPPAGLSIDERHAYAYYYGTHRKGAVAPCRDFASPDLVEQCIAAVRLECLVFADIYAGVVSGHRLRRPRCVIPEPPMDGFWAMMRRDLFARTEGTATPTLSLGGDVSLGACKPVLDECYAHQAN